MQLGVTPWDFSDRSASGLLRQAELAESLGYGSFWLPENHFNSSAIPDPLMLLAAVAAGTERIRLGTTSLLLPLRNSIQTAEQVAVLDQLSEGRLTLGIGRGYAPQMFQAFEVDPGRKRALFEESLDVLRAAWSGEPMALPGSDETIQVQPLPVQRPHPPLWVAAFGPKALTQAGRLGLPYLASPMETLSALESNYTHHAQAAVAAGHSPVKTVPIMRSVYVAQSTREAARIKDGLNRHAAGHIRRDPDSVADDWTIVGDAAFVKDRIAQYQECLGVSHMVVTRLRLGPLEQASVRGSLARLADVMAR